MPQVKPNIRPAGVGSQTVRLADIPLEQRRKAALKLMNEAKDTSEYARLFELVYAPGDAGGRISA